MYSDLSNFPMVVSFVYAVLGLFIFWLAYMIYIFRVDRRRSKMVLELLSDGPKGFTYLERKLAIKPNYWGSWLHSIVRILVHKKKIERLMINNFNLSLVKK